MAVKKKDSPEYFLQLNKLLCGLHPNDVLATTKKPEKKERGEADELLAAVITNWKSLKNTSPDGLRSSFLQRKGVLTEEAQSWVLKVETTAVDILLGSLPWSYNMIRLPWMLKMIQVEW
ncbi:MAG: hypothetical protein EOO38_09950 [Cytophagaceae bacterium]|nr:MAG: hypothetical protein EOO38_09950 [Cytophagaceae bacterium]